MLMTMKGWISVSLFLLGLVPWALCEKQISLDDIEMDNLRAEKDRTILHPPKATSSEYYQSSGGGGGFSGVPSPRPPPPPQYEYQPAPVKITPSHQYQFLVPPSKSYRPFFQYRQPQIYAAAPAQYYHTTTAAAAQYITDNSITAPGAVPNFYTATTTPRFIYIQPFSAPTNAIQAVIDPKGGGEIQYVMYVPVAAPNTNPVETYQMPPPPQQQQQIQFEYDNSNEKTISREPKSLLDSYVPSVVQLPMYYKMEQQRARENALIAQRAPVKFVNGPIPGKMIDYIKSYSRPQNSAVFYKQNS